MSQPSAQPDRGSWATRIGFILAAVGSAVGLGNMWRFSYIASEGGGAAFVVLYLVIVATVGIPILTSEFVIGRLSQESPVLSLQRLAGPAWRPLAWLFVVCGVGILTYYAVIAGWTLRYAVDGLRGAIRGDTAAYFGSVSEGGDAVAAQLVVMALTIWIVARGVKGGLERANLVMMPALFVILIGLALWAATLPNGGPGYAYYLRPEIGELFSGRVLAMAAGQAFFSLSLGMGTMMTYASYLRSQTNLGREAATVALTDTAVAFTAGLVVFPVIFNFGLSDRIAESTVGALFISLPAGFEQMGTAGNVVAFAFFTMLAFAALTSAISLLEVPVAALVDGWKMSRPRASVISGIVTALIGLRAAFDVDIVGASDQIVGNFLLITGGFFICLLAGYRLRAQADAELAKGLPNPAARRAWLVFVRFIAPALLLVVMYSALGPTWRALLVLLGFGG
ncbi:MAG TPA: sodium-dependent transporter [Gemmatimonadales bacterium]|nr:sodium-dependent transporter [Gemmatimonadales bacterium]